jgi:hypothetical protein
MISSTDCWGERRLIAIERLIETLLVMMAARMFVNGSKGFSRAEDDARSLGSFPSNRMILSNERAAASPCRVRPNPLAHHGDAVAKADEQEHVHKRP